MAGVKLMVWEVRGAVASPPPQAASKAVAAKAMAFMLNRCIKNFMRVSKKDRVIENAF
ncbi:hypothetical protein [Limnohabitans planktonicus]|uniref:hypothetical protein n=1 Tax=Limnohabitans planktonicus TaxID=540060 RepID=UPI001403EAB0|nr:hypothetical protein [Limnohabitans planktonicus]